MHWKRMVSRVLVVIWCQSRRECYQSDSERYRNMKNDEDLMELYGKQ
jgi:hypothetical protein